MSTAKFALVGLFAIGSGVVCPAETSSNVQASAWYAAAQHGRERGLWNSLFTDKQATASVIARPSDKLLVGLLFAALAGY